MARCPFSGELTHLASPSLLRAAGFRGGYPLDAHERFHGCQYTSLAFGHQLQAAGILPSMCSAGDCYDNAVAESFFATLKTELVDRQPWPTRQQAKTAIFEYLEGFYNRRRRHSGLGYLSPAAFEAVYYQEVQAA